MERFQDKAVDELSRSYNVNQVIERHLSSQIIHYIYSTQINVEHRYPAVYSTNYRVPFIL